MVESAKRIMFGGVSIPEQDVKTKIYNGSTGKYIIEFKNGVKAEYSRQSGNNAQLYSNDGEPFNNTTTYAYNIMGLSLSGTKLKDEITLDDCKYSYVNTHGGNTRDHVTFKGGHDNLHGHGPNEDLTTYTK